MHFCPNSNGSLTGIPVRHATLIASPPIEQFHVNVAAFAQKFSESCCPYKSTCTKHVHNDFILASTEYVCRYIDSWPAGSHLGKLRRKYLHARRCSIIDVLIIDDTKMYSLLVSSPIFSILRQIYLSDDAYLVLECGILAGVQEFCDVLQTRDEHGGSRSAICDHS